MNIHSKTMRVITITGKIEEHRDALHFCFRNGYRVVRSEMRGNRTGGVYDNTRYKIIAERVI